MDKSVSTGLVVSSLGDIMSSAEQEYLSMGIRISGLYQAVMDASDQLSVQQASVSHAVDGFLHDLDSVGSRAQGLLADCGAELLARLDEVSGLRSGIGRLDGLGRQMRAVVKRLRVLCMTFRIEGSRTEDGGVFFDKFLVGMNRLVDDMERVYDGMNRDIAMVEGVYASLRERLLSFLESLEGIRTQASASVSSASNNMATIVSRESQGRLATLNDCLESVRKRVDGLVVAQQYHDICRQQVEHVVTVLTRSNPTNPVLRIQCAQLAQAAGYLDESYGLACLSLQGIGDSINGLVGSIGTVGNHGFSMAYEQALRALDDLGAVYSKGSSLLVETAGLMGNALAVTTKLALNVDTVAEVNDDLFMQAINATIISSRLGSNGRGLTVIAEEVIRLSGQCRGTAVTVLEVLDGIKGLRDRVDAKRGTGAGSRETLPGLDGLRHAADGLFGLMNETSNDGVSDLSRILGMTEGIRSGMGFIKTVSAGVGEWGIALESLIDPDASDDSHDTVDSADVTGIYTMRSERVVHAGVMGEAQADDIGANVELF